MVMKLLQRKCIAFGSSRGLKLTLPAFEVFVDAAHLGIKNILGALYIQRRL